MRRSAAPSQTGLQPRAKFCVPVRKDVLPPVRKDVLPPVRKDVLSPVHKDVLSPVCKENINGHVKVPSGDTCKLGAENLSNDCSVVGHETPSSAVDQEPVAKKPRFSAPTLKPSKSFRSPATRQNITPGVATAAQQSSETQHRYFSVVWCKKSSKKHKKWEGDAVLVTHGRGVVLYDIEGKEIGKSTGYKSTELLALGEDDTLPIGGKEIQVMSILTEDSFKSGKCFTGAGTSSTSASNTSLPVPVVNKPFMKPLRPLHNVSSDSVSKPTPVVVTPRYDPTTPGALVMPRPSATHQWKCNKAGLTVVDVVVDPYLSVHLRPHQREGVTFLYECIMGYRNYSGHGAILADDMGLGKTIQCISLIWTLYKQGPYGGKSVVKKVLVITPGSLVKNWFQEFKKWLGSERLSVFPVSADNRVEEFMKTSVYPVMIISYEMFVRMYDNIKQMKFDLIVCDEGHRLKNTNIKTTSLIMSLETSRRVVLTGTPIQNDLQEFYSIVEFCNPGVMGSSAAFRKVYEEPIIVARQPGSSQEQVTLGEERGAELARLTQMFVLRRTQEINNKYLPPKCEIVLFCPLSPLQRKLYQQMLRCQLVRSCLTGSMSGSPHLICIAALKQLCNHPSLIFTKSQQSDNLNLECKEDNIKETNSVYKGLSSLYPDDFAVDRNLAEHSGKLAVLGSLLHQLHGSSTKEKIVVVSNHTKTLDMIQIYCGQYEFKFLRLDGQTVTSRRQELVQRFNSKYGEEFIFLLSSKAGGVGLNLIGASRLILYDIDWNPANDLQAMARVWRDGQKRKVHIYRLLTTGTIEEKVYQRQISKQGLSGAIMDVREKNDVQFAQEDLRDLFSMNINTVSDTHDLLNCDCASTQEKMVEEGIQPAPSIRQCQLGVPHTSTKKRNLGMDELMDWKHSPGSMVQQHPDWYLGNTVDKISFVFHSEVKHQNQSIPQT